MTEALSPLTFPPELYKRLVPAEFLARHLSSEHSIRPDSREPSQFRDLGVTTGSLSSANGSSVVRLGNTVMTCGVRAEITEPDPFHPKQGFVVPNIEIGPLCHASFRSGPPSDLQQYIAYALLQTLTSVKVLDLEELCIEESKAVWVLYVDIVCLSHGGSLLSAATTAMTAALLNTSLPFAQWDVDSSSVVCKHEYRPIKVHVLPHVFEVGVFDGIALVDLTDEEEELCSETMVVTMNAGGSILELRKSGGHVLATSQIDQILQLLEGRVQTVDAIVRRNEKHRL